jgi:hypothetical protein
MSLTRLPGVPEKLKAGVLAALALVVMFVCENRLNLAFAADKPATGIPASISAVPEEINEAQVPLAAQSPSLGGPAIALPFLSGRTADEWANLKIMAGTSSVQSIYAAPVGQAPYGSNGLFTPTASTKFLGMANSTTICPPGGCGPPDMALAASPSFVMQGVNTSFAVYNTVGTIQPGWPKSAQAFFNIPAPSPAGCASQAFVSDPRAFYDSNTSRFWVAILEVENAFGVHKSCNFLSKYWVAVSETSNPNGAWFIYAFDMSLGTGNAADFTQIGFDSQAFYFGGNMFNQSGSFQYDEIFGVTKSTMIAGGAVMAFGFSHLSVGGHLVDTLQPVEAQDAPGGPRAGLFINSFDITGDPSGNNCVFTACHGVEVWAMAKPGTGSASLTGTFVSTNNYIIPPSADEPGCTQCIDTNDTRIAATPVYHDGLITFGLNTGLNNGTQTVPGILWGQVAVKLTDTPAITTSSLLQNGYFDFSGDGAASFPALMPDDEGNLYMVFEFMNSSTNPESVYTARRVTFTAGTMHDTGTVLFAGGARYTFSARWGDFEATTYDGRSTNNVWVAGMHSLSSGNWGTGIGKLPTFPISTP